MIPEKVIEFMKKLDELEDEYIMEVGADVIWFEGVMYDLADVREAIV